MFLQNGMLQGPERFLHFPPDLVPRFAELFLDVKAVEDVLGLRSLLTDGIGKGSDMSAQICSDRGTAFIPKLAE